MGALPLCNACVSAWAAAVYTREEGEAAWGGERTAFWGGQGCCQPPHVCSFSIAASSMHPVLLNDCVLKLMACLCVGR